MSANSNDDCFRDSLGVLQNDSMVNAVLGEEKAYVLTSLRERMSNCVISQVSDLKRFARLSQVRHDSIMKLHPECSDDLEYLRGLAAYIEGNPNLKTLVIINVRGQRSHFRIYLDLDKGAAVSISKVCL